MRLGIIILAATFAIVASTAMGQGNYSTANESEINSSTLKDIILGSTIQPETYLFTLDMDQRIEIINVTESNKTESQVLSTRSFGVAALNLSAEAMKIVLASLTIPAGQEENASAMATEMYLLNDTVYVKVDGNWTKIILVGSSIENLWSQENEIEQQREQLNSSNITLLGYEKVNGIDCYKIKVVPDLKAYTALQEGYNAGIQGSQVGSSMASYLNLSNLFNNTSISEISWISKDKRLPVKTEVSMNMTLSPMDLGLPSKKAGSFDMRINTSETVVFSSFNRSINITLPEDAKMAMAFPSSLLILGNSSSMNSTSANSTQMG